MNLSQRNKTLLDVFAVILALIGVVVAIYFGIRQTPTKAVTWTIDAEDWQTGVINGSNYQTSYITLSFRNTGGVPLVESDFKLPISLNFGDKAKIMSWSLIRRVPDNLDWANPDVKDSIFTFHLSLLNPGDSFSIQVFGTNLLAIPRVGGRIIGISDIPIEPLAGVDTRKQ